MGNNIQLRHLPSLKDSSNLSELDLDMDGQESSALRNTISILSTLDPPRLDRLRKIALGGLESLRWWFDEDGAILDEEDFGRSSEDGKARRGENWRGLDTVLSELAKASISARGES